MTQGARDIDSTPPATTMSAAPALTMWLAMVMALIPDAHSRLTVMPGTVSGKPASSQAIRATLRFSSPAPLALPRMTSSTSAGSMPARSDGVLDGQRGKVVGPDGGERAPVAAHGRADAANQKGLGGLEFCGHGHTLQRVTGATHAVRRRPQFTDRSFYKYSM